MPCPKDMTPAPAWAHQTIKMARPGEIILIANTVHERAKASRTEQHGTARKLPDRQISSRSSLASMTLPGRQNTSAFTCCPKFSKHMFIERQFSCSRLPSIVSVVSHEKSHTGPNINHMLKWVIARERSWSNWVCICVSEIVQSPIPR